MNEKLTLESVVNKLSCDCLDCLECDIDKGPEFICTKTTSKKIKDIIKQILEQVRPLKATASMMLTKEQVKYYNFCVNDFDQNIKAFLEGGK